MDNYSAIHFVIIIATYHRSDLLLRAVASIKQQTYTDWEIIIINDSPEDTSYLKMEKEFLSNTDNKIMYMRNEKNSGKNFSLNKALNEISHDKNHYTLFLDDDDWLHDTTLETAVTQIQKNRDIGWYVSNRATEKDATMTRIEKKLPRYSYIRDCLISKRISGDATHIIRNDMAKKAVFLKRIKNGEEWFYFSQIRPNDFIYYDFNSTYSSGYDYAGLNYSMSPLKILKNTPILFCESMGIKEISPVCNIRIVIYFIERVIKATLKYLRIFKA